MSAAETWQPGDPLHPVVDGVTRPMIELIDDLEHVVDPPVTWVVSWPAPVVLRGRLPITNGEPGSAFFDTEAEALADAAEREKLGYRCEIWTIQGVA